MFIVHFALLLASMSISLSYALDICEYQLNGTRLAHPADCSKFVVCKNGRTQNIRNCPIGLHFNRFKGVCDLRERAACDLEFVQLVDKELDCSVCCTVCDCNSTAGTPTPENPEGSSTPTPECPDTPTPESPATPTPETPEGPGTPTPEIPDTPTPETPENPGTPTPEIPHTPTPEGPGTPTPENPGIPTPETPVTPASKCSNNSTACNGKPDGSVSYVNGTCNQYIVCVGGCANILSCPNNLQYNMTTNKCDYPQNVKCPWQSKPPTTGPSGVACAQPGNCAGKPDGILLPDPNSNGYIVCQCECEIERPCPAGTKFNEALQGCGSINNDSNGNSNGGNDNGSNGGNDNGNNGGNDNGNNGGNDNGSNGGNDNGNNGGNDNGNNGGNDNGNNGGNDNGNNGGNDNGNNGGNDNGSNGGNDNGNNGGNDNGNNGGNDNGNNGGNDNGNNGGNDNGNNGGNDNGSNGGNDNGNNGGNDNGSNGGNDNGNNGGNDNGSNGGNDNGNNGGNDNGNNGGNDNGGNGNGSNGGNDNGNNTGNDNGSGTGNNNSNNTICTNGLTVCQNQTDGTQLAVEGKCNKFYVCNYKCPVEIICPNNLIYNPNNKYCDYPQNYKCPWPYTPPSGPNAGPSGIACASGGRCIGKADGTFFSSNESQSNYIICQCECEVELNCPAGLVWDNKLLTCNYPANNA